MHCWFGNKSQSQNEKHFWASRRVRRFGRISRKMLSLAVIFLIYFSYFGIKMHFHDTVSSLKDVKDESNVNNVAEQPRKPLNNVSEQPRKPRRQRFFPCGVPFLDSVTYLLEPEDNVKFTRLSLGYVEKEERILPSEARFGGHQTLKDREKSYHATNQTIHCGFVSGPDGFPSSGFDLDEKDKKYMNACRIVVSSCIFGSFDFLRRPTSKLISEYSKKNVCFVMFVDEQTLAKLSAEGNVPDERGNIGLWKIVVVKNLPYEDMRKTGKVPKFLSHRLFPSSRYSIWLDSKLRLNADPLLIIEYFLWRAGSEYAISNHYTRHCVWEEVLQNKRLNKYNHSAIDEQFHFYQSDGLTKYDSSDPRILPSFVPEGSFIVRAHTAMSNLFSCLWFNEVDRFTSRDQLSFAYTYLKLKRLNPEDVNKLWRVPPERAVYYPDQTYGLSEYLELPISVQTHFTETVRERKLLEDSIAAGNGLAIDGAWLARPEHVTASIERYTVERPIVSFGAKAAITAAADALFDHYKELYDMPKPMTVADVMKNSKWKYAAGLPFMPYIRKRQTLQQTSWYDAIARAATKILESGRMPAVGLHGFPKAQVVSAERLLKDPSAMRTVTAGDRITAIAVNTLLMERNKRVGNIDAGLLNMMRRSEGSIVQIGQDIRRFPNIYSGDATRFDSTVVAEVATVGSVRLYQRGIDSFGVYNSKAAVSVVHAYYEALTHGLIVNLIDGSVVWKTGGGGTGSAATTPDNRDWTRMVMIAAWSLSMGLPARDFFKHVKLTNASDDVFFSVDDQTDAKLQDWIDTMKTEYGVRFAFTREENLNNILHLVKVPEEEVDREIYSVLGVAPPIDSLRVSPKRMLLMRSAYRSDRMKLNNVVAATYLADRSTGYQLLSAHSPDIYNLVTQDLIDAQLAYMSEHFATATAMVGRSESGLISDYHIDLGTQRPSRSLVKAAKRAARRNPGRPDYEERYIAEAQRKAKIWLRQRRGKSYKDVMALWIKTPPPPSDGRSGRRWQRINAVASAIGPLSDLVRLGVIKLSTISEIVPKALTSITPEIATLGVNRPFMTWDFTIEQYIWRREFSRIGKAPPISRLHELIRQSPYAAITDIAGFEALLRNETVLRALVAATTTNRKIRGSIWAVSNDAITGRVICILALYTTIDLIIRFMEQKLIFGVFVMAAFGVFRLLDVFYSLQSLAFWVCTGMASLAISNTVPRDKYILQKKLSVILASLVPGFITDYWFGVFAALPYLAKIIELQAIVPWLILAANTEMSQKVLQQGTGSFDLALEFWIDNNFEMFLLGGVGSGKSTALPAAIAHSYPRTQIIVLVPTNALVTNYVNDFLEDNRVLRIHREYPRDTKFVHNLIVMTYAQFWRRTAQLATDPIVLFDECHVASNDIFLAYQECLSMNTRRIYLTATFGGEFCAHLPQVVRFQQPDRVMPFVRSAPIVIPDTGNLNGDYVTAVRKAIADGAEPHTIMSYHPSIKTLRLWSTAFTGMGTPIRFITADHTDTPSRSAVFVTGVVAMGANIRPAPKVLIYAPKTLVPVHRYHPDEHGIISIRSGDLLNHISLAYVDMPSVDKHQLEGRVGREADGTIYVIGNATGGSLPARINMAELSMLSHERVDALLQQVVKYPGFLVQHSSDIFLGFFSVARQNEQLASLGCAFAALVLSLGTFPAVFDCIAFARHSTEHADALANSNMFLQQFGLTIPPVLNFWAGLAAFCQTCSLCLVNEVRSNSIPICANNGIAIYDLSLIATKLQVHERPFSARVALAGEILANLPKFALRDVSETLVSSVTPAIYFDFDAPGVDQMITLLGGVAVVTPNIIRLMQLHVRICEPRLIHFSCCPSELAMGNMYLCVGSYEQYFVVFDTDSNLLFISGLHHVHAQLHISTATREVTMPLLLPHTCHQIFLDQEERSPPL